MKTLSIRGTWSWFPRYIASCETSASTCPCRLIPLRFTTRLPYGLQFICNDAVVFDVFCGYVVIILCNSSGIFRSSGLMRMITLSLVIFPDRIFCKYNYSLWQVTKLSWLHIFQVFFTECLLPQPLYNSSVELLWIWMIRHVRILCLTHITRRCQPDAENWWN